MADTKKVSQPSLGTEDLGRETNTNVVGRPSAGTDTQLHIATKGKKNKNKNVNDDEKVVRNSMGNEEFLKSNETDE